MKKKEIKGIKKALDILRWKSSYFGGIDGWNYIASELSDKLPDNKYFEWDDDKEKTIVKKRKV